MILIDPLCHITQTRQGEYIELDPLCVLDFYVEETFQRRGIGLALFSNLLETFHSSGNSPQDFAYDRPSPKLIAFLKKHYQLIDHFPQPNNFLIFDAFFKSNLQAKVLKANNKETRQKENR
jgi:alpha-tubulin N-acetyltransferase 1